MPQYAEVEGIGRVEFPDDASVEEITHHVQMLDRQRLQPVTPAPLPAGTIAPPALAPPGPAMSNNWTPPGGGFSPSVVGAMPTFGPSGPPPVDNQVPNNQSIFGISPDMFPSGAGTTMPALTIPISAVGKLGAGIAQYGTSPQGLAEIGAAMTPAAPLVALKWASDMAHGAKESVEGVGQTLASMMGDAITRQQAAGMGVPLAEGDVTPPQENAQALTEHIVNAAAMALGAGGALRHGVQGVAEALPRMKPAEPSLLDLHGLVDNLQKNQISRGPTEAVVPPAGATPAVDNTRAVEGTQPAPTAEGSVSPPASPSVSTATPPVAQKALRYGDVVRTGTTHSIAGFQLLDDLAKLGIEYDPAKLERGDVANGVFTPEGATPPTPLTENTPPVVEKPKEPAPAITSQTEGMIKKQTPVQVAGALPPTMEELAQKAASPTAGRFTPAESALLDEVRKKEPATHKAYLNRVMELTGSTKKPYTAQLPASGPTIDLQGPRLLEEPERLGFKVGHDARLDPTQLYNRLKNMTTTGKLSPGEFGVYEKAGLEAFLKTKPTVGEAAKWMRENGPRVEVRKFTNTLDEKKANAREAQIQHELDTRWPGWEARLNENTGRLDDLPIEANDLYGELTSMRGQESARPPRGERAHWSSVSPRLEHEMEGYVEGAVVVPATRPRNPELIKRGFSAEEPNVLHPSTHSFPPNTLGFFRGYMEKTLDGRKVFHVVEVQSDWAQKLREARKEEAQQKGPFRENLKQRNDAQNHPLLADWERLTLKAAVDHAVKEGADEVAVSDAATAMMTEGHDRAAAMQPRGRYRVMYQGQEHYGSEVLADAKTFIKEHGLEGATIEDRPLPPGPIEPEQAKGMRLHYDRTLPSTLGELTGAEGVERTFGEHRMAYAMGQEPEDWGGNLVKDRFRQDLIFKNPDGTPKTSITARSYDLSRLKAQKEPMSLMGKDRMSAEAKENKPVHFENRYGAATLITKDPASGKWRTTEFDSDKNPKGHEEFGTWKEAYKSVVDAQNGKQDPAGVMTERPWGKQAFAPSSFDDVGDYASREAVSNVDALGLRDGGSAYHALRSLATQPHRFGNEYAALADFYTRHFEPALRATTLDPGAGTVGRTHFLADPADPRIYLSLGDNELNVAQKLLHESSHAALWWRLENAKTPEHLAAKATLQGLRKEMLGRLTDEERSFFTKTYEPYIRERQESGTALSGDDIGPMFDKAGIRREREGIMYALTSDLEFTGALGLNKPFMGMLRSMGEIGKSGLARFVDAVKTLLGLKQKTGAAQAFDALMQLSQDAPEDFGGERKPGTAQAPPPGPALVNDMTREESLRHKAAYFLGKSAPRHLAVGEGLGNKLVGYASARITAPLVARSMATDVLGGHYKDPVFSKVLGAALVEDQLRAIKKGHEDAAAKATDPVEKQEFLDKAMSVNTLVGQPYSPFKTEALYQGALNNPEVKAAIQRHIDTIQKMAEQAHVELGGKLAKGGEQTDAFSNFMAIHAPDDVEGTRSMIYSGGRQGNITNQLRKGSAFSKQRKGTAAMYETDYRTMAERMIRGNWEQKALRDYIKAVEQYGVGVEEKAGEPPPTSLKGKPLDPHQIELRGAGPGQTRSIKLHLRPDLSEEWEQAKMTDSKVHKAGVGYALSVISDLQMAGPTDAVWHGGNMLAAIATSPGGFKNPFADLLRRVPVVNVLDAVVRSTKGTVDAFMESPEVQRELAKIAKVGAGRAPSVHSSFLGKIAEKVVGTPKVDPSYVVGKIINAFDKGGRLARNRMFDNLVERGWATDTEANRREFINKMGQYNRRLMSQFQNHMRDYQIAPFVVAGRSFNRLAFQKLVLQSPGYEAASPRAAAYARVHEVAANLMALAAFPVVANMLITKTPWGRPGKGVPAGMVDTGKDDEDGRAKVWDPLQLLLLRRGMRELGLPELDKGRRQGLPAKETAQNMLKTAFNAYAHPWLGPVAKFGVTAKTGYDTSGFLLSRNPEDLSENIHAAMAQLNPSYAAFNKVNSVGEKGGLEGVGTQLAGAAGFKKGYFPTAKERTDAEVAKLGHEPSLGERLLISKQVQDSREPNTDVLAKREASKKVLWRDFARQDRMMEALTPESQQFLAKNKLTFQGFQNELSVEGIKMPVTGADQARMEKVFTTWYQKGIDVVQKMPGFATMDQQRKQLVLDKVLDEYRKAARQTWLAVEAQKGRGVASPTR